MTLGNVNLFLNFILAFIQYSNAKPLQRQKVKLRNLALAKSCGDEYLENYINRDYCVLPLENSLWGNWREEFFTRKSRYASTLFQNSC